MTTDQFILVGLGELLWDDLPDGKMPGGAPANFAYVANRLGNRGIVASRVGADADGRELVGRLAAVGVDVSHIQIDEEKPTGIVRVGFSDGQPHYEIVENVAWDFLQTDERRQALAAACDAVCFGSLAQRSEVSHEAIIEFLRYTRLETLRIFDVNLRQNFYTDEILIDSLEAANVVKLNHEELPKICEILSVEGADEKERAENLFNRFDLELLCITRGARGSWLVTHGETNEHFGIKTEVADTIGAGDAFTAAMTHGFLRGWSLTEINDFANKIGAFVASQTGAMPSFESLKL